MPEIGSLIVKIGATTAEFEKKMDEVAGKLESTSKKFESAGKKMTDVGKSLSLRVTAPLMAVGTAAFAAANDLDKAMATIRAGTGATGKDLEALGKDFRAVFTQVPQGADVVSSTLADLNTRTGLTGQALQTLTKQTLDLARVAGVDASALVAQTTRVFGDWGIEMEKTGQTLDYLWNVSQTTGIGVDALSQKLVQFGAPLRQMGFDLETSAAMLGKWEKEGVNAELILGSLRIGLVNFAKAGEEPPKAMRRAIEEIKNLGSAAEANALACEIFGARAGPDMAAAIREGRFDLDELLNTLQKSPETIAAAAQETMTFGESMQQLKNRAEIALEPLGKTLLEVFTNIQPHLERAIEYIGQLSERFANLSPRWQAVILAAAGFLAVLGPLLLVLGPVISSIGSLMGLLPGLGTAFAALTGPIGLVVAAIAGAITAGVLLYKNWDEIKARLIGTWESIEQAAATIWALIKAHIINMLLVLREQIAGTWNAISQFLTNLWTRIRNTAQSMWNSIYGVIRSITDRIENLFTNLVASAFDWGRNLLSNFIAGIRSMIDRLWDTLADIGGAIAGFLGFRSPTKFGPGREADKWAPNFVEMYAKGLESNLPKLQAGIKTLAGAVATGFTAPAPVILPAIHPVTGGGTTVNNYHFNINVSGGTAAEQAEDLLRELARRGVRF